MVPTSKRVKLEATEQSSYVEYEDISSEVDERLVQREALRQGPKPKKRGYPDSLPCAASATPKPQLMGKNTFRSASAAQAFTQTVADYTNGRKKRRMHDASSSPPQGLNIQRYD